ncbi:carbon starvation protein A [Pseudoflavonifractor sp. MSJ-37]|uniref:carbon starvation CstA family protein n=1 Tax=Pseudoflavonifractor sp. MSJ-37 TaxID=2841531 RepID=UPI001C1112F0|nr:carbon starvation protein A [Pseudoflavonifractor sp. MSJ-37]MBU5435502.1 carbon starvation protein A [Pseudoflavonifractor sp. MSJ-37]
MVTFFVALLILIIGFFTYSKLIEKVFHIDDRQTPAVAHPDGVDYIPMKTWRIFLIQLLNIAGLGPIYGALSGACWGPSVYLWIVFGTILGGGVHDFLSGMMSEREDGASISEVVGRHMGRVISFIMRIFSVVLLIMVGVNFSVGPAGLLAKLTPDTLDKMFWLVVIMIYYLLATFLPIDKIIGKIYPLFGLCLIVMALGIGGGILVQMGGDMPELTLSALTTAHPAGLPKWSMMFITVACGAISGFHATQSPMMARCIKSEKEGRTVFYGAMVAEGIIALIWAAAGVTFYTHHGSLLDGMTNLNAALNAGGAGDVVYEISTTLLGPVGGVLAMIGVIACPITSGDTAYRSARLTIADWFHIDQSKVGPRAALSVPLLGVGAVIALAFPWSVLWRYFSWSNQTLAMMVLWTGAVFLHKYGYPPIACLMAALPAAFMSAVSVTYFFQAPECLHLSTSIAYPVGILTAVVFFAIFWWRTFLVHKDDVDHELAK